VTESELKTLWKMRLKGLKAADALIRASRQAASVDELLQRADRMFLRSANKDGKEEERVREIWFEWRKRAAAAGAATGHP
jgi:hypothetical protein